MPDVGIPFVNGRPAPVPRDADFGLTSDRATADDNIVTARLKHDFSPSLSVADTVRYANYAFDYQFAAPNFGSNAPTASTPLDSILVGRDSPSSSGVQTNLTEQLDLTARFTTGPLRHVLVTGVELARQTNGLDRYNNPFNSHNNWVPETPLLDPDPNEAMPAEPVTSVQDTTAYSQAIYATDTIGLGRYFDLIAGLRLDRFAASYNQLTVTSGAMLHLDHVDHVASPHVALVFKPTPTQSYYVTYGTSFDPSAEALTLTTKTANLGPEKGTTFEAGAKTTWLGGGLLLTGAIFRTEVDNAQTNDPDNPTITVLNGDERVQGLELGAVGHLTSRLSINAGYTYLDGETIGSGVAADVGKVMPNLARNAVNLWTEYHLTPAWEVGVGGNYLGKRYADSGQAAVVPSYVVWNAMTSWRINPQLKLQFNAINLFDKLYYEGLYYTSATENHVVPGGGQDGEADGAGGVLNGKWRHAPLERRFARKPETGGGCGRSIPPPLPAVQHGSRRAARDPGQRSRQGRAVGGERRPPWRAGGAAAPGTDAARRRRRAEGRGRGAGLVQAGRRDGRARGHEHGRALLRERLGR